MKKLALSMVISFVLNCFWCASPLLAQITLDGTLGQSGPLSGPDYQITSDLGQQMGGNLYHSFGQFNIHQDERATFSGPDTVNNIISRVTGGLPSQIDGVLRSTIPNANVYLLNPAGIMFGEGAWLDVLGSFHASTADTLRFEDGSEFNVRQPGQSLLTVAPPRAFGFLTETPGAITLQDSNLEVPEGKTLSIIGGSFFTNGTEPISDEKGEGAMVETGLMATSGRINLASIASSGEIKFTETGLNFNAEARLGRITLKNTFIDTSGEGGGEIYIRTETLDLHNSFIAANTRGMKDGKGINIKAKTLTAVDGTITSSTFASGQGGNINIDVAETMELIGEVGENHTNGIFAVSDNRYDPNLIGNAGNIELKAGNLILKNGSEIGTSTWGLGQGGNIKIQVHDLISLSGEDSQGSGSHIATTAESEIEHGGDGGTIELEAKQLHVSGGGQISSNTWGTGQGGKIHLKIANEVILSSESSVGWPSGVFANSSMETATGNAGAIIIEAKQLRLKDGALIKAVTKNSGHGGNIKIQVTDSVSLFGKSVTGYASEILAISTNDLDNAGRAGEISVQANTLKLTDDARISTSSANSAGGNIAVTTSNLLYLRNRGAITTDVKGGEGNGGNITIAQPTFVVLDQASIISKAKRGYGGDIRVDSQQYLASTDKENILNASSDILERSGQIVITAPTKDLGVERVALPTMFFHNALKPRCQSRDVEKIPSFSIRGCLHPPPDRMRGSLMGEDWEKLRPLWSPNFY